MTTTRDTYFKRIEAIESEFGVARLAARELLGRCKFDPMTVQAHGLRPRDIQRCLASLEDTYIIRLFAEFETALREIQMRIRRLNQWPKTHISDLINGIAGRLNIPTDNHRRLHEVRMYRNGLVHEGQKQGNLGFSECRSRIGAFLGFVPHHLG